MLRTVYRYLVTGDAGEQLLIGCQPGEDPIGKACRQSRRMRKSEVIRATMIDRITRDIRLYEHVKAKEIMREGPEHQRRSTALWQYVDARNDWGDPHVR